MVENGANGVEAAVDQGAGIGAIVLDARLRVGAIGVQRALVRDRAAGPHGITGRSLGTHATVRSAEIHAIRARVTGMVVAFVDVQTALRPSYKPVAASGCESILSFVIAGISINIIWKGKSSFYVLALVVDAHLVVVAPDVGGAAHLAHPIDAQFPRQAVAVAVAQLHAYSILATFTLGAVVRLAALALAESGHAQVLTGAILGTLAYVRHSDAALLGRGIPVEAEGTGARGCVIGDATDRVRAANILPFARIWNDNRHRF